MFDLSVYPLSEQFIVWGILAYVFGFFHFIAEPYRWFIYARNISNNPLISFFHIFSFTALASYILPFKLGLPFRIYLLNRIKKMSAGVVMGLLIVDGLIYYAGWGVAALLGVIYGATVYLDIKQLSTLTFLVFISVVLLWIIVKHYTKYLPDKIIAKFDKIKQSLLVIRGLNKSQYTASFFIVITDILSQIFRHYAIFMMLGISIPLTQVAVIASISIFTGIISMMPMGLVGYDAMFIILAQQAGIPMEQALLIPLINRFISMSLSGLLGIWGGLKLGYNPFKGIQRISHLLSSTQ